MRIEERDKIFTCILIVLIVFSKITSNCLYEINSVLIWYMMINITRILQILLVQVFFFFINRVQENIKKKFISDISSVWRLSYRMKNTIVRVFRTQRADDLL